MLDGEQSDAGLDGDVDDGAQAKQEYVKKEFVARTYVSPYETDKQVRNLIVRNQR